MEEIKILTESGNMNLVYGLMFIYNSMCYFIYTEKELDENEYVVLYVVKIGKKQKNDFSGALTNYMVGVEIADINEWKNIQEIISKIVEDKKNGTNTAQVSYPSINLLNNLHIESKKKFRLLKNIVERNFNILVDSKLTVEKIENLNYNNSSDNLINKNEMSDDTVIDYRTEFFEEQEKNKKLQSEIEFLQMKIENIKKALE